MLIYKPFSIVSVPFPFTDSGNKKRRPALVLSTQEFQQKNGHITLLMITTAKHSSWYGDHQILDLKKTGLPVESIVRQKTFTLDIRLIEKELGHLSQEDKKQVILKMGLSFAG